MARDEGWTGLFSSAFGQSRNAMTLVDERRRHVDLNGAYLRLLGYPREALLGRPIWELVRGGPQFDAAEWAAALADGRFTGEAELVCADDSFVAVQWGATAENVTGRRLVLFVALSTSRWGARFRREPASEPAEATLSGREREVIRLVALGASGPEIADELMISHNTVRTHVRNAMTKAGARSRAHLVAKAIGDGLVIDPSP
jgi:DNA-binding CsgD family transcriptional regulator